jgi:hypothetical protein
MLTIRSKFCQIVFSQASVRAHREFLSRAQRELYRKYQKPGGAEDSTAAPSRLRLIKINLSLNVLASSFRTLYLYG